MNELSEEALMRQYQEGDGQAFAALFDRLAGRVHGFFRRSFDEAVSDDLLQATFLNVHRARDRYRPGDKVRPWIFAIAANVRMDELRRRYRLPSAASEEEVERALDRQALEQSSDTAEVTERAGRVRAALAGLPSSQRTVIELNRFEGLSFGEIATALGITEGAAKLRAFRGYAQLRAELGDLGADLGADPKAGKDGA